MSELKEILQESVTRLFGDMVTRDVLTDAENGAWPEALWAALEENGLTNPLSIEELGGVGATWDETFVILKAAGQSAAPVPLAETIVATWLAGKAGLELPGGPMTLAENSSCVDLTVRQDGGTWRLSGTLTAVPWGSAAEHVVLLVAKDGVPCIAITRTSDATVSGNRNMAREPRDTLTFDDAPVEIGEAASSTGTTDPIRLYGALVRSVQMAGAIERAIAEAVQYAQDRTQFGQPISKFQSIQHQLAHLAAKSAQTTIAAASACRAADRGDPQFEIATAKIIAGETAKAATTIAHQVHGAIGFTYEHALHFTTRRLWSWRPEFGPESQWAEELGRRVAARGADAFWADLTQRQSS
jgi:acyl-CoA dehydrogenase